MDDKLYRAENNLKIHTKLRNAYETNRLEPKTSQKKFNPSPSQGSLRLSVPKINKQTIDFKSPDRKPLQENNYLKASTQNQWDGSIKKKSANKIIFSSQRASQERVFSPGKQEKKKDSTDLAKQAFFEMVMQKLDKRYE